MSAFLILMAGAVGGIGVGYVTHELAHYVVAAVAGLRPQLSLRTMTVDLDVVPLTPAVRLAALAPLLFGTLFIAIAVALQTWNDPLLFGLTVGLCIRMFALSSEDRDIALGRIETP